MLVRRITEEDWTGLRYVRLAALSDSPSAFGSTLHAEQQFVEQDWREWCRWAAVFIAWEAVSPVGIAAGVMGDIADQRNLISLWVRPDHRGVGLASDLVTNVVDWARTDGADRLALWVASTSEGARRLYERHGFVESGIRKPLPSAPTVDERQMVLQLS